MATRGSSSSVALLLIVIRRTGPSGPADRVYLPRSFPISPPPTFLASPEATSYQLSGGIPSSPPPTRRRPATKGASSLTPSMLSAGRPSSWLATVPLSSSWNARSFSSSLGLCLARSDLSTFSAPLPPRIAAGIAPSDGAKSRAAKPAPITPERRRPESKFPLRAHAGMGMFLIGMFPMAPRLLWIPPEAPRET